MTNIVYLGDSITHGVLLDHPDRESPPAVATNWIRGATPGSVVFLSNQGHSGHTRVDFLPLSATDVLAAEQAARTLLALHPGGVIFSVMLGTNDSAVADPHGAPVSPREYTANLTSIFAELLREFPASIIVVHRPMWYSPNTYNAAVYEQAGLDRLQTYFPAIDNVVRTFSRTHPHQVYLGDTQAFEHFAANYLTELTPESGANGTFYLHPNAVGARVLGYYWASAIGKVLRAYCGNP